METFEPVPPKRGRPPKAKPKPKVDKRLASDKEWVARCKEARLKKYGRTAG